MSAPAWVHNAEDEATFGKAVAFGAIASILERKGATISFIAVKESVGKY